MAVAWRHFGYSDRHRPTHPCAGVQRRRHTL